MIPHRINEECARSFGFPMREIEELLLDCVQAVIREQIDNPGLGEPQLVELTRKFGCAFLVHTGLVFRNVCSFSATSSIPPKNS